MPRPLRFPNPGSDVPRLVHTFRTLAKAAKEAGMETFDLDFMTEAAVLQGQASSRGAVGREAIRRSREADRSRDPLYNQLKMYSEVYRMLGWFRPTPKRRLEFSVSVLGDVVAEGSGFHSVERHILSDSLLSITFPNPNTDNLGIEAARPFRWLMLLALELDGMISRHEIILGVLTITNDREPTAFDRMTATLRAIRGSKNRSQQALDTVCSSFGVSQNTLENYTRLPVAVLKDPTLGWGEKSRLRLEDGNIHDYIQLTSAGLATAEALVNRRDLREKDIDDAGASLQSRAALAEATHIEMMRRAGLDVSALENVQLQAATDAAGLLSVLGEPSVSNLLYSPMQQASDQVIAESNRLYG